MTTLDRLAENARQAHAAHVTERVQTMMYDNQSLPMMAEEIAAKVEESDRLAGRSAELLVEAAKVVVEAKKRLDEGAVQGVGWYEWAEKHTGLKKTRLDELHSIGSAKDPMARAQEIHGLNKARAQRHPQLFRCH